MKATKAAVTRIEKTFEDISAQRLRDVKEWQKWRTESTSKIEKSMIDVKKEVSCSKENMYWAREVAVVCSLFFVVATRPHEPTLNRPTRKAEAGHSSTQ